MAAQHLTANAAAPTVPGPFPKAEHLLHHLSDWGRGRWVYRGTREELIAAGLVEARDFPGEPGGPVASRTYQRGDRKCVVSINSRVANPMTYWVRVMETDAEGQERNPC